MIMSSMMSARNCASIGISSREAAMCSASHSSSRIRSILGSDMLAPSIKGDRVTLKAAHINKKEASLHA